METKEEYSSHIYNQPTINIGSLGHVMNGKTTIVKSLSTVDTKRYQSEQKDNKTIKLGYANAKFWQCSICPKPDCYQSSNSDTMELFCKHCDEPLILKKHVSFVDSPGHHSLMATMLNGTAIMDSTILVESASNDNIPAPQTAEHLLAMDIMNLPNACVCFNKLDLTDKSNLMIKIRQLQEYLQNTSCFNSPIIPLSANFNVNTDILIQHLVENIPNPIRDLESKAEMIIIRSFNINKKQCIPVTELKGGVVGGSLIKGRLQKNTEVILMPGLYQKLQNSTTRFGYRTINSRVLSMNSEKNDIDECIPGGLIGVQLTIDPAFTSQDGLVGNIMFEKHDEIMYKVYETIDIKYKILNYKLLCEDTPENKAFYKFKTDDQVIINCNANDSVGMIISRNKKEKIITIQLNNPICAKYENIISISKKGDDGQKLIGQGEIIDGIESTLI